MAPVDFPVALHAVLRVVLPRERLEAGVDGLHGDAALDGADERAQVAADAVVLHDVRLAVAPLAVDVDALTGGAPYHIVANLPYNVGTALFTRWLEPAQWPPRWISLTLMFQLEVAERIVAPVGTNAYGRLAVLAQWRSNARVAMKVHRSAFTPPPKVMSAIVHVTPGAEPAGVDPKLLSKLTEKGFGQRRKMLRQSLKGVEGAVAAAESIGIDPTRRAETVSVAEWVELARTLGG